MLKLLAIYSILIGSAVSIFRYSWFPAAAYSLNAVMQPKYIWRFEWPDLPISKLLAICSILAWGIAFAQKRMDLNVYKSKQVIALVLIWGLMHLSDTLSPYQNYSAGTSSHIVLGTLNTIVIMFIVQIGILSDKDQYRNAAKVMAGVYIFLALYYVYWANDQYLSYNWAQFFQGRLMGPYQGPYDDANSASTLLVMAMPFMLFAYFYVDNKIFKYGILAAVPLLWHALFLFGSRGAFLGLGVSTIVAVFMLQGSMKSLPKIKPWQIRMFKFILIFGLAVAVIDQGGAMLNRSATTVSAAQQEERDEPLNPRLVSWQAALGIIAEYPALGAGPQRFQWAARDLNLGTPHVAHNTLLNFTANTGVFVGGLFLFILWTSFKSYFQCNNNNVAADPLLDYLNKACTCSLVAYCVCGTFLDLIIYEPFFFVLLLIVFKNHMVNNLNLTTSKEPEAQPKANPKLFRNQIDSRLF
ncbi:O-antigen ligase family protein [Neiella sp. HB171785]|uniref:O-antigen ligase family protein n=1 Tax=Neiella litorisoli TaxID=2771431 RepID=A0A8J6UJF4_9GAMM|nr:O-antigen ligase family protein [Neiella litorisoli]MBD1390543.1 O-antigen ligase family protein [Neiella litorisoli]